MTKCFDIFCLPFLGIAGITLQWLIAGPPKSDTPIPFQSKVAPLILINKGFMKLKSYSSLPSLDLECLGPNGLHSTSESQNQEDFNDASWQSFADIPRSLSQAGFRSRVGCHFGHTKLANLFDIAILPCGYLT